MPVLRSAFAQHFVAGDKARVNRSVALASWGFGSRRCLKNFGWFLMACLLLAVGAGDLPGQSRYPLHQSHARDSQRHHENASFDEPSVLEPITIRSLPAYQPAGQSVLNTDRNTVREVRPSAQPSNSTARIMQAFHVDTVLSNHVATQETTGGMGLGQMIDPTGGATIDQRSSYFQQSALDRWTIPHVFMPSGTTDEYGAFLLVDYQDQIDHQFPVEYARSIDEFREAIPQVTSWTGQLNRPIGSGAGTVSVSLNGLIHRALRNSHKIQIAAIEPHLRQSDIVVEAAEFDWSVFLESQFDDLNEPIGSELTTGNNERRFRQQQWTTRTGVKKTTREGGQLEVSQRLGYLDNNSRFLSPPNQGSSRLEINFRQPLLNGSGKPVNEALIVLADIDLHTSSDNLMREIQVQLFRIASSYWELVRARAEYLQKQKLLENAKAILKSLEGRADIDVTERQLFRTRSEVSRRMADVTRATSNIRNVELRLRSLVNDPELTRFANAEFIPVDLPGFDLPPISLRDAMMTALVHRPEISRAIHEVRAVSVRLGIAENDLLPKLDLLVGTYVAGLDGDSDVPNAWVNQFRDGRPSFNFGLEFELPVGNRAAKARQNRVQWEGALALRQFQSVVETSLLEVEQAVLSLQATQQELSNRYQSMKLVQEEVDHLFRRWELVSGMNESVTVLLNDLLNAQVRLADEELAFAAAQTDLSIAILELKRSMGTLFQVIPN